MLFRSILWGSTSPRPSAPGEGESSAVAPQKHATGFAGCSFAKPEPCACCSFSLGEKVRMRAVPEEFCLTPNCEGCISFSERCQANGLPGASNASAGRGFCRARHVQKLIINKSTQKMSVKRNRP